MIAETLLAMATGVSLFISKDIKGSFVFTIYDTKEFKKVSGRVSYAKGRYNDPAFYVTSEELDDNRIVELISFIHKEFNLYYSAHCTTVLRKDLEYYRVIFDEFLSDSKYDDRFIIY